MAARLLGVGCPASRPMGCSAPGCCVPCHETRLSGAGCCVPRGTIAWLPSVGRRGIATRLPDVERPFTRATGARLLGAVCHVSDAWLSSVGRRVLRGTIARLSTVGFCGMASRRSGVGRTNLSGYGHSATVGPSFRFSFVSSGACLGVSVVPRPRWCNAFPRMGSGRFSRALCTWRCVSGGWCVWACRIPARAATASPARLFISGNKFSSACPCSVILCCIPFVRAFGWLKRSHLRLVPALHAGVRCGADLTACVVFRSAFTYIGVWVATLDVLPVVSGAEYRVGTRHLPPITTKMRSTLYANDCRTRPSAGHSLLCRSRVGVGEGCYLVDPASSHMLVSKIKPCMCKYELIQTVKLRMAH